MEKAWAAGLFEGEGCLAFSNGRPRLQLKMIHESSVRRFHEAMGLGKVYGPYGPYESQLGRKPTWMWVADGVDVQPAMDALRPYLTDWSAARLDRKK